MRRLLPLLLLLTVPALCWAGPADLDAGKDAPKQGGCVYARPLTTAAIATTADTSSQPARAIAPSAARSAPKPVESTVMGGDDGGNDSEMVAPRARNMRWHSFLPGMFR